MKDPSENREKKATKLRPPTSSTHSLLNAPSVDVILAYSRHYYEQRVNEACELDNKAGSLLSTAGAVAALATLGFTLICDRGIMVGGGIWPLRLIFLGFVITMVCFVLSACFAIAAYWATRLKDVTNPIEVLDYYLKLKKHYIGGEHRLKEVLAFKYADAAWDYVSVIDRKVKYVLRSQWGLVVGLVFLGVLMVSLTWGVGSAKYRELLGEQITGSQLSDPHMKEGGTNGRQTPEIPTGRSPSAAPIEADDGTIVGGFARGDREGVP